MGGVVIDHTRGGLPFLEGWHGQGTSLGRLHLAQLRLLLSQHGLVVGLGWGLSGGHQLLVLGHGCIDGHHPLVALGMGDLGGRGGLRNLGGDVLRQP